MGGRPDQAGDSEETAKCTAPGGPDHDRLLPDDLDQRGTGAGYRRRWLLGRCGYSSTAMAPCPLGDWRSSAPGASGRHTCGTFGSCCCRPGIRLDWSFKRCVQNQEMEYPPLWVEVRMVLGTRDSWAEDEVMRRAGRIFTAGSK